MDRRIFGIETEYGVTCTFRGQRRLSPDEGYLFHDVLLHGAEAAAMSFCATGPGCRCRQPPEYATAECDSVTVDRPMIVRGSGSGRAVWMPSSDSREEGIAGDIYLFKNNTDSAGNSYGCHENFLVDRSTDFLALAEGFIPFLISRQIVTGAGRVLNTPRGRALRGQRADPSGRGIQRDDAVTPIINTRDEPHADADLYRRLHVIVGDSNMSETTAMLKVGAADLVLRMLESGAVMRDLSFENPIRAIREISHDTTGTRTVTLNNGREVTALQMQAEYFEKVAQYVDRRDLRADPMVDRVMDLWERALKAVEAQDFSGVETEIDWVIKQRLLERYMKKHDLALDDVRIAQLDLAYHDISRQRGLFYLLERKGLAARITNDAEVFEAKEVPPQTTRAKLRGDFVKRAQETSP